LLVKGVYESDFVNCSSKLRVLDLIIAECVGAQRRIVVVSEFDRMRDLIQDLTVLREFQADRIQPTSEKDTYKPQNPVILYNSCYCVFSPTIDNIDTLVIVDGVSSLSMLVRSVIYLLCSECCEPVLQSICHGRSPTDDGRCGQACRTCAIVGFMMKRDFSPAGLREKAASEISRPIPSELELELYTVDICTVLIEQTKLPALGIRQIIDASWSGRERDELIRWLFRFD
jgi:hypothetical protein